MDRYRALATLVRWLGPWAGSKAPPGIHTEERTEGVRVRVYRSARRPIGVYVVSRTAVDDLSRAYAIGESIADAHGLPRPAIFSISFGSQPTIELAAREPDRIGPIVLFGGFADFDATVRYAVGGPARDPNNAPVVFLHLLPHMNTSCDREAVARAWNEMVRGTWGRPELKVDEARAKIAAGIAASLAGGDKELFLAGCGLRDGAEALLEEGLARSGDAFAFADPRPALARVKSPIVIVHGKDDDVIPWTEAEKLAAAAPRAKLLITGMYGHTGSSKVDVRAMGREVKTMLEVVRAMIDAPLARP
jgi:pimeloyl-ACP methyl ester carboxylesterase